MPEVRLQGSQLSLMGTSATSVDNLESSSARKSSSLRWIAASRWRRLWRMARRTAKASKATSRSSEGGAASERSRRIGQRQSMEEGPGAGGKEEETNTHASEEETGDTTPPTFHKPRSATPLVALRSRAIPCYHILHTLTATCTIIYCIYVVYTHDIIVVRPCGLIAQSMHGLQRICSI